MASRGVLKVCRDEGKPIILDVVDLWPQSTRSIQQLNRKESHEVVLKLISEVEPNGIIFPNFAMWCEFREYFPAIPSTFIYHHYRPELDRDPIRFLPDKPIRVAYEGGDYLGEWEEIIRKSCAAFGLRFDINPENLTDCDVIVSARGNAFKTFLNTNYKSNVKATNAIGACRPFLVQDTERSAHEVDPGSFMFFSNSDDLRRQLEIIVMDVEFRKFNFKKMLEARPFFNLSAISSEFDLFFHYVVGSIK
jgi:hypothetical protein